MWQTHVIPSLMAYCNVLGPKASSLVLEVVESIEKEYFTVEAVDGYLTDEQSESEEASFCDSANELPSDDESASEEFLPTVTNLEESLLSLNLTVNVEASDCSRYSNSFLCSCKMWEGRPCILQFESVEIVDARLPCLELTRSELDLVLLGKTSAGAHFGETTLRSKHPQTIRKKARTDLYHHAKRVCRDTFQHLHCIGEHYFENLGRHYRDSGCVLRIHENSKRSPSQTLSFEAAKSVFSYIDNYAETNAMLLPGRVPGYKRDDLKLLPSSETKASLWRQYKTSCEEQNQKPVSLVSFRRLWQKFLPNMVMMRPATDLCWTCQQNSGQILRSSNLDEEQKSQLLLRAQLHLSKAKSEREFYKQCCNESKTTVERFHIQSLSPHPSVSLKGMVHYSFDMAQQIHFPYNPQQPSPVF